MFSESMWQVACNWVDVGSFHTRLVVRFMTFTASVRNILDTPSYISACSHCVQYPKNDCTVDNRTKSSDMYVCTHST
jgi:hypothetical protein